MPKLLLRGKVIGDVKAVIFDKDGTLINSELYLFNLAKLRIEESIKLLKRKNCSTDSIIEAKYFLEKAYGIRNESIDPNSLLAIASREQNLISTATIYSLIGEDWPRSITLAKKAFMVSDLLIKKMKPNIYPRKLLPGAKKVLNALHENNVTISLMTNDSKSGIQEFISSNNLEKMFTYCWSSEDYPSKPNPEAIRNLCKLIKIDPCDCALIGDADTDLGMAKKSKVQIVLGFTAGWFEQPELSEHHHLIHHWDELNLIRNPKV